MSITNRGIHARSFNKSHLGVEMLGDYDNETPNKDVIYLTYVATSLLLKKIGRTTASVNFHRDDPLTTKSCPGVKVSKSWFIPGLVAVFNDSHINDVKVHIVKNNISLPIHSYIKKGQSITTAPLSELEVQLLHKRSTVDDHEVGVASFLKVNDIPFNWDSKTKTINL